MEFMSIQYESIPKVEGYGHDELVGEPIQWESLHQALNHVTTRIQSIALTGDADSRKLKWRVYQNTPHRLTEVATVNHNYI